MAEKGHVCPILQQVSFRIDRVLLRQKLEVKKWPFGHLMTQKALQN